MIIETDFVIQILIVTSKRKVENVIGIVYRNRKFVIVID